MPVHVGFGPFQVGLALLQLAPELVLLLFFRHRPRDLLRVGNLDIQARGGFFLKRIGSRRLAYVWNIASVAYTRRYVEAYLELQYDEDFLMQLVFKNGRSSM